MEEDFKQNLDYKPIQGHVFFTGLQNCWNFYGIEKNNLFLYQAFFFFSVQYSGDLMKKEIAAVATDSRRWLDFFFSEDPKEYFELFFR